MGDLEAQEDEKAISISRLHVPIWKKILLTVDEASAYSNIGSDKIRQIMKEQECNFVLYKGTHKLIKRKEFEKFIENLYVI